MLEIKKLALTFGACSLSLLSFGQANCGSATPLTIGTQQCATNNNNGSFPNNGNAPTNPCNASYNDGEYWFSYTGTGGALDLDVTALSDTYSGLFVLDDCPSGTPACIASYTSGFSTADFSVTTPALTFGQTYYIVIANWGSPNFTNFCLDASVAVPPTPPANDDCSNAIALTVNPDENCTTVTSSTVENATASPDPTANSCFGTPDDDVWYTFVPTQTNHILDIQNVAGSTTDMYHSVYEEGPGCPGLGTEIICNDGDNSVLTGLTIGNTYYVRVYTYTSTTGQNTTFDICLTSPPPPPANVDCSQMEPICTSTGLTFTANVGGITDVNVEQPGNNYDCLGTSPDPTWYYIEVATSGDIDMNLNAGSDIDFVIWGPFSDVTAAENACGSLGQAPTATNGSVIDCSFSFTNDEYPSIPGAVAGEVYVMVITNYAGVTQTVTLTQTGGTGATDCSIVTCPGADAGSW